MRIVFRKAGVRVPYPWLGFATRFKASKEFIGKDFFKEFAREGEASFVRRANAGLMESFNALKSDCFDPDAVHPIIKDFYENTSSFNMELSIWWNPIIKPFGKMYRLFYADRIKQTMIPLNNDDFKGLDHWIETIDTNHDKKPEFRCWIRVVKNTGKPVYVGAYKIYDSLTDDHKASYISVAFPIPTGSITTVLSPKNIDENGLFLTTKDKESREAGLYLIFPHKKSYSFFPAMGLAEEFELKPKLGQGDEYIDVKHTCYWLGMKAFIMSYKITENK